MTSNVRRVRIPLVLAALGIAVVGCGGSDDASSEQDAAVEVADDVADVTVVDPTTDSTDSADAGDAGAQLTEAIGADEVLSQVGIDTIGFALSSALGGEYEIVDETTIRLILEGELEADSVMSCIVAGGVVEPGTTVIVSYPDGEQTCE